MEFLKFLNFPPAKKLSADRFDMNYDTLSSHVSSHKKNTENICYTLLLTDMISPYCSQNTDIPVSPYLMDNFGEFTPFVARLVKSFCLYLDLIQFFPPAV